MQDFLATFIYATWNLWGRVNYSVLEVLDAAVHLGHIISTNVIHDSDVYKYVKKVSTFLTVVKLRFACCFGKKR